VILLEMLSTQTHAYQKKWSKINKKNKNAPPKNVISPLIFVRYELRPETQEWVQGEGGEKA
jgi:hypothetical protein